MTFPLNPNPGDTYKWWTWNGEQWVCASGGGGGTPGGGGEGGGAFVGPNPPAGPTPGVLWFNTTNGILYVFDGSQWNAATPHGVTVSATAPTNPATGDFWFNTTNDFLYIWTGTQWDLSSVDALTIIGATAPTPPVAGMLWHDTTNGNLYVYDGATSSWILAHPVSSTSGPTPPANPQPGELWWNTSDDIMYVWDGSQWINTAMTGPAPVGGINYVGAAAPTNPQIGELWYNTTNNEMFIWDGSAWLPAAGITGPQGPPGATGPQGPPGIVPPGGTVNGNMTVAGTLNVSQNLTSFTANVSSYLQVNPGCWPNSAAPVSICGWGDNSVGLLVSNFAASFTNAYTRVAQFNIDGDAQVFLEMTINATGGGASQALMGAINILPGLTGVAYTSASDMRLKKDDVPMDDSGAIIDALKPIKYRWKSGPDDQELSHGFSAQDLAKVFPEAAFEGTGRPGQEGFRPWTSDNSKLVPVLVAELKELRKRVKQLEASLAKH